MVANKALQTDQNFDVSQLQNREFMQFLSKHDRKQIEVTDNFEKLMRFKRKKID